MKLIAIWLLLLAPALADDYSSYIGDTHPTTPVQFGLPAIADVVVTAIATDAAGNTYLTGSRTSMEATPFVPNPPKYVFVTKVSPMGQVVFTRFFGGNGADQGTAIALDPAGDIYVAGSVTSTDFVLSNALQTAPGSSFIVKLSPDGNTLLYSTYFGDLPGQTSIAALATDTTGNLYLTGTTAQTDFPVTFGTLANSLGQFRFGAFITELDAAGDRILYSGVIAGTAVPCQPGIFCGDSVAGTAGLAITVDSAGEAFVAGNSNTTDLPTTPGVLAAQGIGAFVMKIQAGGGVAYLTYIGSTYYFPNPAANVAQVIAIDSSGNAYLAGTTNDPKFPATAGSYQTTLGGYSGATLQSAPPPTDAFAAKLSPDGSHMVWATYVGGSGADMAQSMAVDTNGNVWMSGTTTSPDFPNADGWSQGGDFLVEIGSTGAALSYAARYPNQTVAQAIGLDATTGLVHAAGSAGIIAGIAPGRAPTMSVFGIINAAGSETSGRVAIGEAISIFGPHIGPSSPVTAALNSQGALPTSLGGVHVSFGGTDAPLLYVSDGQINALVPPLNNPVAVTITNGTNTSPAFPVVLTQALPQVFRNADGSAVALNQDGSLNTAQNPAQLGSIVSIWLTGTADLQLPVGQITTKAVNSCSACEIEFYSPQNPQPMQQATVLYAGPAPGLVSGFTQINFQVESGGPYPTSAAFYVAVSGYLSNPFSVYVTN
jgi:uncharacterized protein (TIGR03437 family)